MNRVTGQFILQKIVGESFNAYVPKSLPPDPPIDLLRLYPWLERATIALGELNSIQKLIPNPSLFIYMYVRKEALLSSQIEGTQSSFSDLILFEHHQKTQVSLEDVEEVSNYIKALNYGIARLEQLPLSLRLLKEIHSILLSGGRGANKLPGEFRRSQNWIGGTRPGNASFVPAPVEYLDDCLAQWEKFLHDESLPALIKAGLIHVQFETIHPFLDGNGRLGRLLITLLLTHSRMLEAPILYLSLYLKKHRQYYYELLQSVRISGDWERWLEFFLEGVFISAKNAVDTAFAIKNIFEEDEQKMASLGRLRFSTMKVFEFMKLLPQLDVPFLSTQLKISAPTARKALNSMVDLGVLEEITNQKRDKIYVYRRYLDILEEGAKPF